MKFSTRSLRCSGRTTNTAATFTRSLKSYFFRLFVFANERGAGLKAARLHNLIAARAPEVFERTGLCSTRRGRNGNTRGRGSNSVLRWTTIYPAASPARL
jgi:hypothetical protein